MVLPTFLRTFQLQKEPIEITWSMTLKSTIARTSTVQAERLALIFYFKAKAYSKRKIKYLILLKHRSLCF